MRFVAVAILLAACHHETKTQLQIDEVDADKSVKATDESRAETKKQDATDVDTLTTKSDNGLIVLNLDGSTEVVPITRTKPNPLKTGAKVIGTVPLETTVVDQHKRIGASTDEKTGTKKSTETDDKGKTLKTNVDTSENDGVGFSTKFYLLAGGILAAVAALGLFLSRSKLIRRLLGVPL